MSENIVRDPCTRCAIKHLSQARILMNESRLGYPHHVWYAMGHMAEAEDELVGLQPEDAIAIREARILIQNSLDGGDLFVPDFKMLMTCVGKGGLLPECDAPDMSSLLEHNNRLVEAILGGEDADA
jgi:hypothetical protein